MNRNGYPELIIEFKDFLLLIIILNMLNTSLLLVSLYDNSLDQF